VEWWLTELAANFYYEAKEKNKNIAVISYGRNYIIEPLEVLLNRYEKSKAAGSNTAILDKELAEWLCSKYKTDPIGFEEESKRLFIEPFLHYTVEQVKDIYGVTEAKKKMIFEKWWRNEAEKNKEAEDLIPVFNEYCKLNIPETPGKTTEEQTEL
jgi:hypothetical protein